MFLGCYSVLFPDLCNYKVHMSHIQDNSLMTIGAVGVWHVPTILVRITIKRLLLGTGAGLSNGM